MLLPPAIWFEGSAYRADYTNPAADSATQLLKALESGAFERTGAHVLHIQAGELSQAYNGQPNPISIAYYKAIFKDMADYCNTHGIQVAVEANLLGEGKPGDWNDQWIGVAQMAKLPVSYVEDDNESIIGVFSGKVRVNGLYVATVDISNAHMRDLPLETKKANQALVDAYSADLKMVLRAFPNAQFGIWIGMFFPNQRVFNLLCQDYLIRLEASIHSIHGPTGKSIYVVEEANWSGAPDEPVQEKAFVSFSQAMASIRAPQILAIEKAPRANFYDPLDTNVFQENRIAHIAAIPGVHLNGLLVEMNNNEEVQTSPDAAIGAGTGSAPPDEPLTSSSSETNLAAEIYRLYPLYAARRIDFSGHMALAGLSHVDCNHTSEADEQIGFSTTSHTNSRLAFVLISDVSRLVIRSAGGALIVGSGTSSMVVSGMFSQVRTALGKLEIIDRPRITDHLNIEAFGVNGRIASLDTEIDACDRLR